uniref:Uncharacterized protein n=1 Tax=Aegilops tauschii TaxID=37682 RepID=R7W839_AEGTA
MQEFTSNKDNGAGKKGVPALHKLYVTPRTTNDNRRAIYGENGVTVGNKKPVPADYFHAAAALLSPGSARGLGQEHVGLSQASQPPPPVGLLHYGGQNFMGDIMPVGLLHYDSQKGQNFMGAAMPANVVGQYQQQHRHYSREVAPPAPPGLHDEDAPSDNLSMPMDQFMRIFDKPAETVKGEPEWRSLEDIVDHDEFVNINKDG